MEKRIKNKPTMTFLEDDKDVHLSPLEVRIKDGGFYEGVKEFKSIVQKEKILSQVKEKRHYEKPSEKKRRKRREAAERRMAADLIEKLIHSGEWEKRQRKKQLKRERKIRDKNQKGSNLSEIERESRIVQEYLRRNDSE